MTHYHVASGLAGYGPDASDDISDGPSFAEYGPTGAADAVRDELERTMDHLGDVAEGYAESGDYKDAWDTHKLGEALDMLRLNLAPERATAPLYRDRLDLWTETVTKLLSDPTFPLDLDIQGNTRLYVWQCAETHTDDGL